jgi:transcriptional regulator with XRE-family HTH domain
MTLHSTQEPGTLGGYIQQARERAGLSLRNLEAITGISRPMLNRLEHDQIDNPSPDVLHRLANALELDSDDLFAFVGYRPSTKLPSLAPYLRSKYQLPPNAIAEASEALQGILEKYDEEESSINNN